MNLLYEILQDNKIQILGLAETHLSEKQAKFYFKQFKDEYTFYHSVDKDNIKSTGVGIMIRNDLNLRVIKADSYRGRIIYLDLLMENKKKIRIIQYYGISGPKNIKRKEKLLELHRKVLSIIGEGKRNQFEIILMGDFNLQYEVFEQQMKSNKQISYFFKIFKKLEEKYLMGDIFKEINQINEHNPLNTWFSKDGKSETRIDYIWCTENFFDKILNTFIYNVEELLYTDHRLLIFSMEGFNLLEKQIIRTDADTIKKRKIFDYENLNEEKKLKFKDLLNQKLFLNNDSDDNIKNKNVNLIWKNLKDNIKQTAIEVIGTKEIKLEKKSYDPRKESENFFIFRELTLLIKKLKTKSKEKLRKMLKHWSWFYWKLQIWGEGKVDTKYWNYPLTTQLRKDLIEKTSKLKEIYFIQYKNELEKFKEKKITEAIEQLCIDLQDNQKRLINNVCDREMKKIIIDHVYLEKEEEIVVDSKSLKEEVVKHFQSVAGSQNKEKEIPEDWKDDYQAKENINENIYKNLMDVPTLEEIRIMINNLAKGKAAGPSEITYELFKLASEEYIEKLRQLIGLIFNQQEIPVEWKNAYIYPIPKPKPWGSRLINTRPITLLDIARKLMMSILTQRLMKIFVEFNVLKGNQFAGLPGNSTFEPIRILNEIIQDANENEKELWIVSLDMSKAYDRVNVFMLEKAMLRLKLPKSFVNIIKSLFLG
jgi:exonuclease III